MRLIDAEKIKMPTSMIRSISGCYMIRVEDMQRIISDQPTAFDKEKVIEELESMKDIAHDDSVAEIISTKIWNRAIQKAIKIVEKDGIE